MSFSNIRRGVAGALFAIGALGIAGVAHADSLDQIKASKKIRIAVDIGAPPYGFLDTNAQMAGSDIEAARLLANDLGVELEVVPVTGPNRIPFLQTKKADLVMASFSITDERKKVIDFSEPYGVVPVVVGGPAGEQVKSFADLKGKRIAVTRGTTSDQELTKGTKDVPDVVIIRYEDDATTNTAVATGQQDWLAAAPSVIPSIRKTNPSRDVETKFVMKAYPYGVGIRKGDTDLKARVDEWVKANLKNGRFNEIYKRHFGLSLPEEMLK